MKSENSTLMRFVLPAPDPTPLVHILSKAMDERSKRESLTHIEDRQETKKKQKKGKLSSLN